MKERKGGRGLRLWPTRLRHMVSTTGILTWTRDRSILARLLVLRMDLTSTGSREDPFSSRCSSTHRYSFGCLYDHTSSTSGPLSPRPHASPSRI